MASRICPACGSPKSTRTVLTSYKISRMKASSGRRRKPIFLERVEDFRRDDPVTNCLPGGPSEMLNAMYRIIQSPAVVALLYESGTGRYRQIYLDGRHLPEDPNPTWLGYSVGHWEGDTLVVESAGFNDRTWLDRAGHPHSENLRVTERFRRIDFGHMQYQITFDDPETLTKPLSFSLAVNYRADTDMLENVCNENNRDKVHMVGTATRRRASQLGRSRKVHRKI